MKSEFNISRLGNASISSTLLSVNLVADDAAVLVDATVSGAQACSGTAVPSVLECAGPRKQLYFDPAGARAAIVTCGGLCPGLNDVVRAVTMVLWHRYGVQDILGIRYGYEGLNPTLGHAPIPLTPQTVEDIHQHGGTILGSSRGPQSLDVMADFLVEHDINMLFTVGGDGTQRGALALSEELGRRGEKIAVVGIPKTIDNDISFTERTFGFETAVAMSQVPITGAHMEAKGARNGIGLVKLMGRESGFVAAYAALASSDVNVVLIPEVPFTLEAVLAYLETRLKNKAHAVVVVAEGAGQNLVAAEGTDRSGNQALGDIGVFLKQAITAHFRGIDVPASVKYIDPSYIIRSAPASADDSVFCFQLGEHAVHAALSGRTSMVVGMWNGHFVHVPMAKAVSTRKRVDSSSLFWQSVLDNTGQPVDLG